MNSVDEERDETETVEVVAPIEPPRRAPRGQIRLPEIMGVPAEHVLRVLGQAWKQCVDHETPTLQQVIHHGIERVDVDAAAGYISIVLDTDTHRAIGVRREMVVPLVAILTGRESDDVRKLLAKGPAKILPRSDEDSQ